MAAGYKWMPMQPVTEFLPPSEELIIGWMHHYNTDREEAIRQANKKTADEYWTNDLYQVEVRRYPDVGWVHLNIRRRDGYPSREWRHFQQIKNELVGAECEGIEIYPAESRLTDTSNKYHLYVCTDPEYRIPFGFQTRDVSYIKSNAPGLRQAPPMQHKNPRR